MPVLFGGFGNVLVPLLLGTAEVAYCRLNNLSLRIYFVALLYIVLAITTESSIGMGWTFYPPLSTNATFLLVYGIATLLRSLIVRGLSSTLSSVNFMATCLIRMSGVRMCDMGAYIASINATSLLLFLVLPALSVALIRVVSDIILNTAYFDYNFGGDVILYRHLFWFFGHPEVYILILPGFGIVSLALSMLTGTEVIGEAVMIAGIWGIAFVGLIVWAHHMYTTGLEVDTITYFSVRTMVIAIPTGAKIFNYANITI